MKSQSILPLPTTWINNEQKSKYGDPIRSKSFSLDSNSSTTLVNVNIHSNWASFLRPENASTWKYSGEKYIEMLRFNTIRYFLATRYVYASESSLNFGLQTCQKGSISNDRLYFMPQEDQEIQRIFRPMVEINLNDVIISESSTAGMDYDILPKI